MNEENKNSDFLCLGSFSPEHEDYLIGNKEGLIKLSTIIDKALEHGEHSEWVGEFSGVKCLENSYFEDIEESNTSSRTENTILLIILISIIVIFIVGFLTTINWVASLFLI